MRNNRRSSKKLKVLHCPSDVGGNALILSHFEKKLGLESEVMFYKKSDLNLTPDIDLHMEKGTIVDKVWKTAKFFTNSLTKYDIFHFNYGSSLLCGRRMFVIDLIDLPLLRLLGKKIFVTYQGCDARQKEFCLQNFSISACHEPGWCDKCNRRTDKLKQDRIKKFARYAHKIFSLNPDLLYVLPPSAEFVPYASVDLEQWVPIKKELNDELVLVHSPTNRDVKGTKYVIEVIARLKDEGYPIKLILVEGLPHNQVRKIYQEADIVIDQLLCGWYGAFAVEMMALGKPVVSYIREEDLKFVPPQMKADIPIVNANPANVYTVLKHLLENRKDLYNIGQKSRAYVENWHDPMKIAKSMKEYYESLFFK